MKQILPEVTCLSAKWELISQVGYREGAGHKLASEDAAAIFESDWRKEVRNASAEDLATDHDLVRVLVFAKREATVSEQNLAIPPDPAVTLAVHRGARSEARSQYLGTRSVHRESRLSWDTLADLYGAKAPCWLGSRNLRPQKSRSKQTSRSSSKNTSKAGGTKTELIV